MATSLKRVYKCNNCNVTRFKLVVIYTSTHVERWEPDVLEYPGASRVGHNNNLYRDFCFEFCWI